MPLQSFQPFNRCAHFIEAGSNRSNRSSAALSSSESRFQSFQPFQRCASFQSFKAGSGSKVQRFKVQGKLRGTRGFGFFEMRDRRYLRWVPRPRSSSVRRVTCIIRGVDRDGAIFSPEYVAL
jgi:hypothetical protein